MTPPDPSEFMPAGHDPSPSLQFGDDGTDVFWHGSAGDEGLHHQLLVGGERYARHRVERIGWHRQISWPTPTAPAGTLGPVIHQLRTYGIFEHNKPAFHRRFADHAWRIMKTHGFEMLAMWDADEEDRPVFVYLLGWPDRAAMDAGWAAFKADEEWLGIRAATNEEHGDMVEWIRDHTLVPVDYSPDLIR